jgi:hypothetical protein
MSRQDIAGGISGAVVGSVIGGLFPCWLAEDTRCIASAIIGAGFGFVLGLRYWGRPWDFLIDMFEGPHP